MTRKSGQYPESSRLAQWPEIAQTMESYSRRNGPEFVGFSDIRQSQKEALLGCAPIMLREAPKMATHVKI